MFVGLMGCKQSVPTRVVEESKIGNGAKYVHRTSDINASVDTESVLEPSNVKLEDRNENSIEESNDGVQGLFCKHLPPVGETDLKKDEEEMKSYNICAFSIKIVTNTKR